MQPLSSSTYNMCSTHTYYMCTNNRPYCLLQVLFFLFPPDDGDFLLTLTLTHTYLCSPYSHANA